MQERIQDQSQANNDIDSDRLFSVYRQIQPCPLRSDIKKLKILKANPDKRKPPKQEQ